MKFRHKGLRGFHDSDDTCGLNAAYVKRIRRVLTALQDAREPQNMDLPDLHLLSGNWRIVFHFGCGGGSEHGE